MRRPRVLSSLGLDETIGAVYEAVLRSTEAVAPHRVAAELQLSLSLTTDALDRLVGLGLVRPHSVPADTFRTVSPAVGFAPLIAQAEAEAAADAQALAAAKAHVEALVTRFGTAHREPSPGELLRRVEAWEAVQQVAEDVTTCVRVFAAAGPAPGLPVQEYAPVNRLAVRAVERGAEVRLVVLDSVRTAPDVLEGVRWMARQGVAVRTVATLPAWMFLVDDAYTLIAYDPADHRAGAIRFDNIGPMAAARELFDIRWAEGRLLEDCPRANAAGRPTAQQKEILRKLADGAKDESIARFLGVSTRTIRRLIADIGDQLGAESRFQIAVRAVERGWLG